MQAGFLAAEKPTHPIPAAQLETLFTKTQAEAKRLRAIIDPEETPYTSRYEERLQLAALSKQAAANEAAAAKDGAGTSAEGRRARIIRSVADGQLGRNFMDTEEPGSAQAKLESAIEGLEGVPEEAVAFVEALNNLGVVWCSRGDAEKALSLLERARDAHAAAVAAAKSGESERDESETVRLDDACTLTTFYLAQVYGSLGRRTESASHVHETMRRQLARRNVSAAADAAARQAAEEVGGAGASLAFGSQTRSEFAFDPQEWARNACDLSKYYATVCRLDVAEHCLYAAESVLAAARRADAQARAERAAKAEAARAAEASKAVDLTDIDGASEGASEGATAPGDAAEAKEVRRIFLNGTADDKAESEEKGRQEAAARAARDKAAQQTLGVSSMTEDEAEAVALVDLAWARMWLSAMKHACELRIRQGEVEEGEIETAEEDDEEKEGRLLGPLSGLSFASLGLPAPNPILTELGSRVKSFDGARELFKLGSARAARAKATLVLDGFVTMHFEVIEVEVALYQQLALWETDLARRHAMHKRRIELIKPPTMELNEKAYTQLVRQGLFDISTIAAEMLEIKCEMHKADPPPRRCKKLEAPAKLVIDACDDFLSRFDQPKPKDRVEEEQERAYIQCHFHKARAHSKLELQPESLAQALKSYEYLAKYLTRNKVDGSEEEAKVCSEMAELLPLKIANAQRTLAAAAASG